MMREISLFTGAGGGLYGGGICIQSAVFPDQRGSVMDKTTSFTIVIDRVYLNLKRVYPEDLDEYLIWLGSLGLTLETKLEVDVFMGPKRLAVHESDKRARHKTACLKIIIVEA